MRTCVEVIFAFVFKKCGIRTRKDWTVFLPSFKNILRIFPPHYMFTPIFFPSRAFSFLIYFLWFSLKCQIQFLLSYARSSCNRRIISALKWGLSAHAHIHSTSCTLASTFRFASTFQQLFVCSLHFRQRIKWIVYDCRQLPSNSLVKLYATPVVNAFSISL